MDFGDKIVISNKTKKIQSSLYPVGLDIRSYLFHGDEHFSWEQFSEMGELITHYAMLGYWPLSEVKMVTYYEHVDIDPIEVLFIGKRYVNIGITGEIIIIYPDEYYDRHYMAGEIKFIPFYNLELMLCVKNGKSNPFFSLRDGIKPKLVFDHKPYKKYMKNNIVSDSLCTQHENHRKTWDEYHKTRICNMCENPEAFVDNDEIPF